MAPVLFLAVAATLLMPAPTLAWSGNSFSADSEQELLTLTNDARASAGLAPLAWDSTLAAIARSRSEDMIERDYFSHNIPPTGEMVWDVMDQHGYCYNLAGENIGWNMNWPDDQATAQIEASFFGSAQHHDNIVGPAWNSIGIGAYKGSDGKIMWTVLFADHCGAAIPKAAPSVTQSMRRASAINHATTTNVVTLRPQSNNVVWLTFALGPGMAGKHVRVDEARRYCATGSGTVTCGSGRTYGAWGGFSTLTTRIADPNGIVRVALSTHRVQWLSVYAAFAGDDATAPAHTATQQVRWR